MTVTVSGAVADITGRRDSRAWKVWSPTYRDGDGITVSSREQTVHITNGVFTAEMEPGEAVIESPDGVKWNVLVPDGAVTLRELLASVLPTSDSQQALIDAVAAYLDERGHSVIPDTFGLGWVSVSTGYAAGVGEMVDADATSGGFTITLPEGPPDLTVVSARKKDTTANPVLVQRSGSDVFTGGVSLVQLLLPGESGAWQYHSGVWRPVTHSQTVVGLDTRYFVRNFIPGDTAGSRLTDANGAAALYIDNTANAVNHLRIVNSATGQPVRIQPSSIIDAIINTVISPKGDTTAYVVIRDGPGNDVARFESVANAVNYVRLVNSPTGSSVTMRPGGADTTCDFTIRFKGDDGVISLANAVGTSIAAFISDTDPVNFWLFRNSGTGEALNVYASGADTNRSFNFIPGGNGTLRVDGVDVMTQTNTYSMFNKKVVPRKTVAASASSLTPVASSTGSDIYAYTALAANLTINAPTSTPDDGQIMRFRFKDNGSSRTLTWNAIYRAIGVTLPTSTTTSKTTYVTAIFNTLDTKWDVISVQTEA